MRSTFIFLTLCALLSPAVFAGDGKTVPGGFKQIHQGMKKVTRAVDKNAKKGFKTVHKRAKKDVKTVDKEAKKTWKKAGRDINRATTD